MDKRIQKYKLFIFVMKNVLVSKLFMKEREKYKNIKIYIKIYIKKKMLRQGVACAKD